MKKTTGMVLGKFMPLHRGHELLLNFAANFVDELYAVTDWQEEIDGEKRCEWLRRTVPQAQVFYLETPMPQAPEDHPDFWNIWRSALLGAMPQKPDYVFASEQYGFKLAEVLGATFIPFDLKRESVGISATQIRGNVYDQWDYLSAAAKRDYLARVCVFGPESSGKSTLARQLAEHYKTTWVPEYARLFIKTKGDPAREDMIHIARGQAALEDAMAPAASRWLFCDTDPLATTVWSRWLFGESPEPLAALARERHYRLYLLTDARLPWKGDAVRYFPGKGDEFLADCVKTLESEGRAYALVEGSGAARLENAVAILEAAKEEFFRL
ncbi:MAG: AAA family ATPase [Alphaproteobacteria bacterium]|nr:AAA family ATPase [Alphaproteobacteria bacterium]